MTTEATYRKGMNREPIERLLGDKYKGPPFIMNGSPTVAKEGGY